MRSGPALAAVGLLAALAAPALGQPYPLATEPPRSTDRAVLMRQAVEREVHERFVRGLADEEHGDWKSAAAEFGRILALKPPEPKNSTAHYDLGIAQAHLRDYRAAMASFEDALKRDPGFTAAAANLVTAALESGDAAAARAAADRFVALAPASARARYARGLLALHDGDLAVARDDFRALIADDPAYAIAHYDLGLVEIRSGRFDVAAVELERALQLAPGYARARFALATVFLRLGRRNDARTAFDRAAQDASDVTLRSLALDLRNRL